MLTDTDELPYAGATRQAELLRTGEIAAPELTQLHLDRIDRLDGELNAFRIVRAERALEEARMAQERLRAGDEAPLLGVPIAVKDNMDVAGELTTHGTGLVTEPATADSEARSASPPRRAGCSASSPSAAASRSTPTPTTGSG
jgi:amidase